MRYAILALLIPALALFIFLQPKYKVLISFFLMMQCFDVVPTIMLGMYVWDYGAILMLITAADVYIRRPLVAPAEHTYLTILRVLLVWLAICFLWSLAIYQYPLMHTIKNARYMLLGYGMTLVFIRLFSVQPDSFEFLMKWFYRLTFLLMPVVALQYVLRRPLLFGLVTDYEGSVRALPVFLPLCLLNFWIISTKILSSERLAVHEWIYALLVLVTVALTYTRGIYAAFILTSGLLVWAMSRNRSLKFTSLLGAILAGTALIGVLFVSGLAQKVGGRAASGIELLSSGKSSKSSMDNYDTFNGRLGLAGERFSMVWSHNPLVGYGFIHEDDVPPELRHSLHYGTVLGGTAADPTAYAKYAAFTDYNMLGLYSSDIAWADIVISTGFVGAFLLIAFVMAFAVEQYVDRNSAHPSGRAVKTGLYLEIMMLFILTFDGNSFYYAVHIPAFLFAGYSLTLRGRAQVDVRAAEPHFKNLLT